MSVNRPRPMQQDGSPRGNPPPQGAPRAERPPGPGDLAQLQQGMQRPQGPPQGGGPRIPGVKPGAEGRFIELLSELSSLMEPSGAQQGAPSGPPGMGRPGGGPPGMGRPPGMSGGGDPLAALLGGMGGPPRPPR